MVNLTLLSLLFTLHSYLNNHVENNENQAIFKVNFQGLNAIDQVKSDKKRYKIQ